MLPTVFIPFQSPRYQYIPTIGFSLLMAYCVQYFLVHKIYSKFEKFKFVSLSFVILLYFFCAFQIFKKMNSIEISKEDGANK